MSAAELAFAVGGRLPIGVANALARAAAPIVARLPLRPLEQWRTNVESVTGHRPDRRETRRLVEHWAMNNLWSMSLGRWSDAEVLARVEISDEEVQRLRDSLGGRGLVLALPHMGSWDFAGAWCARVGIRVVSVAERLPRGLFERFRDARAAMGMKIYPVDERDLMDKLADDVRDGSLVCLLGDRDLSRRGLEVRWPSGYSSTMPPGPALLAARTGCHLRVTTTHLRSGRVRLAVSDTLDTTGTAGEVTQRIADQMGRAITADPTNWLVLQPIVRR